MDQLRVDADGPRFAVVADGVVVGRSESLGLALGKLEVEAERGEFLELSLFNVRLACDMGRIVDLQIGAVA